MMIFYPMEYPFPIERLSLDLELKFLLVLVLELRDKVDFRDNDDLRDNFLSKISSTCVLIKLLNDSGLTCG